jgi:hypothetical protein
LFVVAGSRNLHIQHIGSVFDVVSTAVLPLQCICHNVTKHRIYPQENELKWTGEKVGMRESSMSSGRCENVRRVSGTLSPSSILGGRASHFSKEKRLAQYHSTVHALVMVVTKRAFP